MANLSITAANVQPDTDAVTVDVTCGENLSAGKVVRRHSASDNRARLAFAESTLDVSEAEGIMLTSGADGQPGVMQVEGTIILGAAVVTVGEVYVLSSNVPAGSIAPASDLTPNDYVTVIGIGVATNKIKLGILASGVLA
jgi:hypothetical protein